MTLKVIAHHYKNLVMDYQDRTQDKIITRYNSCIKAKQAHDYSHFKAAILHKEKQSAYMPCQYHLNPFLELPCLLPSQHPNIFTMKYIYNIAKLTSLAFFGSSLMSFFQVCLIKQENDPCLYLIGL